MEKFRAKIRKRVILLSMTVMFLTAIYLILLTGLMDLPPISDFIKGFNGGIVAGVEIVLVFFTVKYFVSMKNEVSMKKLYIKENDERTQMIMQKTGEVGMTFFMIISVIATIISGFFNETVFFTLLGATVFSTLIRVACKLYYHTKL